MNPASSGSEQVAIITGAARGLGIELVRRLAREGGRLMLSDLDAEGLQRCAAIAREAGAGEVAVAVADLSEQEGGLDLARAAVEAWGRIDILVNNAGGGLIRPFLKHDAASLRETLARNLWTTLWCCHAVLPHMVERRYGRVINLGAESVRNGLDSHAGYNAAKGGVHGLTTGLAREFAPFNITVNTVAPSGIMTPEIREMLDPGSEVYKKHQIKDIREILAAIPMGRIAEMHEVAAMVAFLASSDASFVTGQVISVNGGSSML